MMFQVAIINDGAVLNVGIFDSEEVFANFDFTEIYGEGAYGVKVPEGLGVGIGWTYDGTNFIAPPVPEPTHEELVRMAENEKYARLSSADSIFLEWQTKLLLNIASEDEKNAVVAWVNYKDAVRAVDTQQAPDITWPEQPPIPEGGQ